MATIISTCDSLKVGVVVIPNHPTIPLTFSKIILALSLNSSTLGIIMTSVDFLVDWTLRSTAHVIIHVFSWKRASASQRHALWLSALIGIVLPPSLTAVPKWRLPTPSVDVATETPMPVVIPGATPLSLPEASESVDLVNFGNRTAGR